jgi:transposase
VALFTDFAITALLFTLTRVARWENDSLDHFLFPLASHNMPRTHGYAPKGKRCFGTHNWNAKGRTNVIGALLGATLLTVTLINANVDSDVFYAWTKQDLLPKLPAHSVLVLDNATFHKRNDIQEAIQNNGHTLIFLPPYSPDLNPIEHKWAQAKAIRRRKLNRTIHELFKHIF